MPDAPSEAWTDHAPPGTIPAVKSVSFIARRPSENGRLLWDQIEAVFDFGDELATEATLKAAFGRLKFERLNQIDQQDDVVGCSMRADVATQAAWMLISVKNPEAPPEAKLERGPKVIVHRLA